jgi:hypothetical protein
MNYKVLIEGQEIPVPEEIGSSDQAVKMALTPYYPEAANAMITRVEKDGTVTITVVKKAGTKGAPGFDDLVACQERKNPAIALYEEIQNITAADPVELLELDARLEKAIDEGRAQAGAVESAAKRLQAAAPSPAVMVVLGF